MDTPGNLKMGKGSYIQEDGEAKRLVTLAILQKGLRLGSYSNEMRHVQLMPTHIQGTWLWPLQFYILTIQT